MMRDIQILQLANEEILISTDNSGAIGTKKLDAVQVPYQMVSYFAFRVAAMELIAAGGIPDAVVVTNFCGDAAWPALMDGIQKGLDELALINVSVGGSSESNFTLSQSAFGLTILGKRVRSTPMSSIPLTAQTRLAVIGQPLVGHEVVSHAAKIAPMSLLKSMSKVADVVILPVGSKGIAAKLQRLLQDEVRLEDMKCDLNVSKSSGPATCFIVAFDKAHYDTVKHIAREHFHEVMIAREGRARC